MKQIKWVHFDGLFIFIFINYKWRLRSIQCGLKKINTPSIRIFFYPISKSRTSSIKVLYQNQGPPVFDLHNLFKLTLESLQNLQNQGPLSLLHLLFLLFNPYLLLLTLYPLAFLPFISFNLVQIVGKKLERSNAMGF